MLSLNWPQVSLPFVALISLLIPQHAFLWGEEGEKHVLRLFHSQFNANKNLLLGKTLSSDIYTCIDSNNSTLMRYLPFGLNSYVKRSRHKNHYFFLFKGNCHIDSMKIKSLSVLIWL